MSKIPLIYYIVIFRSVIYNTCNYNHQFIAISYIYRLIANTKINGPKYMFYQILFSYKSKANKFRHFNTFI